MPAPLSALESAAEAEAVVTLSLDSGARRLGTLHEHPIVPDAYELRPLNGGAPLAVHADEVEAVTFE